METAHWGFANIVVIGILGFSYDYKGDRPSNGAKTVATVSNLCGVPSVKSLNFVYL